MPAQCPSHIWGRGIVGWPRQHRSFTGLPRYMSYFDNTRSAEYSQLGRCVGEADISVCSPWCSTQQPSLYKPSKSRWTNSFSTTSSSNSLPLILLPLVINTNPTNPTNQLRCVPPPLSSLSWPALLSLDLQAAQSRPARWRVYVMGYFLTPLF